jgi:hypothetical protein
MECPGAACHGRGGGGRVNGFRQGSEGHLPCFELIEQPDQGPQRPAQAIELPDHQHIPSVQRDKAPRELWPFHMYTRGLVGEYPRASCPLQGGELQGGVLVLGRDATIADVHTAILTAISDVCKPLFLQDGRAASQCLISDALAHMPRTVGRAKPPWYLPPVPLNLLGE